MEAREVLEGKSQLCLGLTSPHDNRSGSSTCHVAGTHTRYAQRSLQGCEAGAIASCSCEGNRLGEVGKTGVQVTQLVSAEPGIEAGFLPYRGVGGYMTPS